MTNTQSFAARELDVLSLSHTDPDNRPLVEEFRDELLALCEKFGNSGQSGGSAPFVATALSRTLKHLLLQEPICPITGIDSEWIDVSGWGGDPREHLRQNSRCSALFKDGSGVYYLDAIVWKNQNGICSTGGTRLEDGTLIRSRQYIKEFPFTPKIFYIDMIDTEIAPDDWEFKVKNPKQLEKVWKYYKKPY